MNGFRFWPNFIIVKKMHQTIVPIDQYHQSDTFLSNNVGNLFEKLFKIQSNDNQECLHPNLTIIDQFLDDFQVDFNQSFDSIDNVNRIGRFIRKIDSYFCPLLEHDDAIDEIQFSVRSNIEWCGPHWQTYILDAIDIGLRNEISSIPFTNPGQFICMNQILSLLLLTSGIEHCIGDVLRLKCRQIPPLMKDLIDMPELNELIGSDLIRPLKVLLGPPTTLNIRNILWHGFINCPVKQTSIEMRPFITTLIAIISTIGYRLSQHSESSIHSTDWIPRSPLYDLSEFANKHFPIVRDQSGDHYEQIFKCPLIHRTMRSAWAYMFHLQRQEKLHRRNQYWICLLFPLLESSMRYLYCHVNHLEDRRLLTAIARQYYVTFREIFGTLITDLDYWKIDTIEEQTLPRNRLLQFLPIGFIHAFNDLIIHCHGPHLRDRLSHGQIRFDHVDSNVVRFSADVTFEFIRWTTIHQMNDGQQCCSEKLSLLSYETQFHKIYYVRNRLITVIERLMIWQNQSSTSFNGIDLINRLRTIRPIDTGILYLSKCFTIVNFLENIVNLFENFFNILIQYLRQKQSLNQCQGRRLRSRQRENFQNFSHHFNHKYLKLICDNTWWSMMVMIMENLDQIIESGRFTNDDDDDSEWRQTVWEKRYQRKLQSNIQRLCKYSREQQWHRIEEILISNQAIAISITHDLFQ